MSNTRSINLFFNSDEELQDIWDMYPREQSILFLFRYALRLLPLLGRNGNQFQYWKKADRPQFIFTLLKVLAATQSRLINRINAVSVTTNQADNNALDHYYPVTKTVFAGFVHDIELLAYDIADYDAATAVFAVSAAAGNAGNAADVGRRIYLAQESAAKTNVSSADNANAIDLHSSPQLSLSTPLWPDGRPAEWNEWERNFLDGLVNYGLAELIPDYQSWVAGKPDLARLQRWATLPDTHQTIEAKLAWLRDAQTRLAEARVIVIGDGGAGKTSLIRALNGDIFNPDEDTTPGVAVREVNVPIQGQPIHVHYWDFGGQIHLHPTHQFFMSSQCVYVVLFDARKADASPVEYWLEHVKLFGGGAPAILVQSQVDQLDSKMGSEPPFDFKRLQEPDNYPFLKGFYNVSCKNSCPSTASATDRLAWGLPQVQTAIEEMIASAHILNAQTPEPYFKYKELLKAEQKRTTTINRAQALALARQAGINDENQIVAGALTTMNNLGVSLHFPKVSDDFFVLDPNWLVGVVYHLLWQGDKHRFQGVLSVERLKIIFTGQGENELPENLSVSDAQLPLLLRILEQFELIYPLGQGQYRAPMLTPSQSPTLPFVQQPPVLSEYLILPKGVPKGLYYRYINQTGTAGEIHVDQIWRSGCVVTKGGVFGRILLESGGIKKELYGDADQAALYMTQLRQRFYELVGKSYVGLSFTPLLSGQAEGQVYREVNLRTAVQHFVGGLNQIPRSEAGAQMMPLTDFLRSAFGSDFSQALMEREIKHLLKEARLEGQVEVYKDIIPKFAVGSNASLAVNVNSVNNNTNRISNTVNIVNGFKRLQRAFDDILFELEGVAEADLAPEKMQRIKQSIALAQERMAAYEAVKDVDAAAEEEKKDLLISVKHYTETATKLLDGIQSLATLGRSAWNLVQSLIGGVT